MSEATLPTTTTEPRPFITYFYALGKDIYIEFNGCTRGRTWFDSTKQGGGLIVWFGRLRLEVSPRSR
ncbi:hypothetical protein [Sedimenticola selenatireducens]|uniref:Uncharacterized protein n=1 Tax=Sedimenticola selenatireducens TaxID=191960 RepID=A0A2N6CRB3_9GAMM|nr:hypothetical protein [Sedimenticola selenatireducens]PLX59587.1 MAG: hypothetical protein C0630_19375 [Sedimenticola selenatireducens]